MRKLTSVELAKKDAAKLARTGIRLRYSIQADHELNDVLPALEEKIDAAVMGGKPLEITAGELFNAAFEGTDLDQV